MRAELANHASRVGNRCGDYYSVSSRSSHAKRGGGSQWEREKIARKQLPHLSPRGKIRSESEERRSRPLRVARPSRLLVSTSRRNELPAPSRIRAACGNHPTLFIENPANSPYLQLRRGIPPEHASNQTTASAFMPKYDQRTLRAANLQRNQPRRRNPVERPRPPAKRAAAHNRTCNLQPTRITGSQKTLCL